MCIFCDKSILISEKLPVANYMVYCYPCMYAILYILDPTILDCTFPLSL